MTIPKKVVFRTNSRRADDVYYIGQSVNPAASLTIELSLHRDHHRLVASHLPAHDT